MQALNVEVPVPEGYQLVQTSDLNQLVDSQLIGRIWGMKDLEKHVGRSNDWLKENVLYPYRKELDVLNGGFVDYPQKQGQRWKFGALKMSKWLERNQGILMKR